MYVKYNSTLHGPLAPGAKPPLSVPFLRKYLTIVKRRGRQALCRSLSADLATWRCTLSSTKGTRKGPGASISLTLH